MMRRVCPAVLVLACALVAAAPAFAAPRLTPAQNRLISNLVERYVNDMVLRHDLADGWKISGPAMRGALKRKAWVSGRQVPVQQVDVLNNVRNAWYAKWKSGNEIGLVLSLKTGHGKNAEMLDVESVLQKSHGRWLVNSFYVDGIFRTGAGHSGSCVSSKCRVTGLADYMAGGPVSAIGSGRARISPTLFVAGLSTLGVLLFGVPLGLVVRARLRHRRALAAYLASR